MAATDEDDRASLLAAAESLSEELDKRHLRTPFCLKRKFETSQLDKEFWTGGWSVTIATWGPDRPAVAIYLDRILDRTGPRQFWSGFWSSDLEKITRLIKQTPEAFQPLKRYGSLVERGGVHVFAKPPTEKEMTRPIAEFYKDYRLSFFGMYQKRHRTESPFRAWEAAQFVADVVDIVSGPELGKNGKAEREFVERLVRDQQPQFRRAVLNAYNRKCCITGCATEQSIEAAHVDRYADSVSDLVTNGIPLRADLHRLFDAKLLDFQRAGKNLLVKVSKGVGERAYRKLNNKPIKLPANRDLWPEKWF